MTFLDYNPKKSTLFLSSFSSFISQSDKDSHKNQRLPLRVRFRPQVCGNALDYSLMIKVVPQPS